MNILKVQDTLKNLSDEQLAQEMRLPSGTAPQYLVMTEMQRREKMRAEFSGQEPPKTTMAEEMSGEAPPEPPMDGPPQEANAQGLMGLPDQTMAGGAMRARISGQPQQVDGMTALPPQGMAAGGAVQFGNPFAGAQMGATAAPSTGYGPVQQYSPKYYAPETGKDYGDIRHQFDGRSTPRTPNPRVRMSEADRYGLPAGMAAPTYGTTPGLNRTFTGREGQNTKYSWANDAARDAYIKSMTPVKKADGGPIRMGGGMGVADPYKYVQMSDKDLQAAASSSDPREREGALAALRSRNSQNRFERGADAAIRGVASIPQMIGDASSATADFAENVLPYTNPVGTTIKLAKKYGPEAFDYLASPGGQLVPSYASERGHGQVPTSPKTAVYSETAQPPAQADPSANAPELPLGELTPLATDYASLNIPTDRRAAPPSAAISGLPSMPNLRPSGGGIASLPKPEKDSSYEDYMKQANALIAEAGGDPKADKDRSFNSALMKLGLGMAASKNQSLLGAVAEGGLPALEQYTADEAQRRKDARALAGEKLTVLGSGMQMRQAAEKDYRDQINKAEELRQRGMESEARMLEAEANSRFKMAELGIRGAELESSREDRNLTRAYQDRVLQATIDNNRATLEKEPDAVRTLKAQYGDKWTVALEVQTLQDNLTEYKGLAQANLNANQMEEAKKYNSFADAAAKRLEDAMGRLYGSGNTGMSATPTKPAPNGGIVQP